MAATSNSSLGKIDVHTGLTPATNLERLRKDSAKKVNELLNYNHARNHIFFMAQDEFGVNLHNHLSHQALTLFAIGASPEQIQYHHERNQLYQRDLPKTRQVVIENLDDPRVFKNSLGKDESYSSLLTYFDRKLKEMPLRDFLHHFVFGPSEQARNVFCRLFHGYVHPLLSFGFGIEFEQPPLVSEGLAQACCHRDDYLDPVFLAAEELSHTVTAKSSSLVECLDAARANPKIRNSCDISYYRQVKEGEKFYISRDQIRDGVIPTGGQDLLEIASRWQVKEEEVALKTAELTNAAAYLHCSAQRSPYESRFDFFTLHGLTPTVHLPAFLKEPAIRPTDAARVVEYLGRTIILLYAGIGCPEPNLTYALSHKPRTTAETWDDLFDAVAKHEDDGHLAKGIRALANAQKVSLPYDDRPEFRLKNNMFLPLARSLLDSGSQHPMYIGHPLDWIRGAGWAEAWENVPKRGDIGKTMAEN